MYEFGPFRVDFVQRILLRGSEVVPLNPKTFDVLFALVRNGGRVLDKDELMKAVWPDTFVEENSLSKNIFLLRKALGEDAGHQYIETIPRRGYRFVAAVTEGTGEDTEAVAKRRGQHRVSFLKRPSVLVGLLAFGVAAAAIMARSTLWGTPIRSLAVFPLKSLNLNAQTEDYLELGMADSIIGKASQIRGLVVRPTSAIRKYAGKEVSTLQGGRDLNVDAVLDGTIQRTGERVRVSVNLLRVRDGASLWADVFEARLTDIFFVQDQIARQVAARLRFRLSAPEQTSLTKRYTANPEAYESYVKGLYTLEGRFISGAARGPLETAIERFKRAVEIDPSYALAYAHLAISYSELVNFYRAGPAVLDEAKQAAARAYALDPDLAELHVFRAWMFWSLDGHFQIDEAIRELRLAERLDPSIGHSLLGVMYSHMGLDEEAARELERAIEIDPTDVTHYDRLAESKVWSGRYDEAIAAYEKVLSMKPANHTAYTFGALPFFYERRYDEAQRRLQQAPSVDRGGIVTPALQALLLALQGDFARSEAAIPPIAQRAEGLLALHHVAYAAASIKALQGKSREAVEWLGKTADNGMPNYPMFARDPNLDRIRKDPGFQQFMAGMKTRWERYQREFRNPW